MNPHREREFDVIILGASGYTGKYVVQYALTHLHPSHTIALAGRDKSKLHSTLHWAWAQISQPTNSHPPSLPLLTFNTTDDPTALLSLTSKARLILNCVGPFRLHGAPIVQACIQSGCDYLDICGEPEFMERTEAELHDKAKEAGSLVVSACGFDSVPAELGILFNTRQFGCGVPNRVEAYLSLESEKRIVGNFATYESAVLGVANADQLRMLRRSRPKRARPQIPGPPPPKGPIIEHQKELGLWAVRLPSADSAVVRRTQTMLTENPRGLLGVNESPDQIANREEFWSSVKPAHFGVKMGSKSLFGTLRIITVGVFIGLLGKCSFGKWLLLKFPSFLSLGWFKKKGPSEDEVNSATFKMWFVGHGYSDGDDTMLLENRKPNTEIVTRVTGPEIGYITTPIILIQCALIVLNQRQNLPKGGVFPPGIVFGATDLQDRLQQNGISFDFISKQALSS